MKKILIVITTGFDPTGGLTTVMMNYYREFEKKGLQIDFASINAPAESLLSELKVHRSRYFSLGNRKKNLVQYIFNYYRLLTKEKYDIVHVNGNSATMLVELFISKICGVKTRISHGHNTRSNYPFIHKILYPFFKHSYTHAIAVSEETGQWLYKKDYMVFNNAIDLDHYSYSKESRKRIREKLNIDDKLVIGNVGKLNGQKNHKFLIQIFKEIHSQNSNTVLLIAGGGYLEAELKQFCVDLQLSDSVIFLGMVSDTAEFLSAFDVFVFTSFFEGLGMALIEAQSTGLRCICSDVVPIETKVTDNIVYMSLDKSASQWAQKVLSLCDYNRDELALGTNESITRNGYNIKVEAKKLNELYRNVG